MFVERRDGAFSLRRGSALEPDQTVVVVEDVFTTGKSTLEAVAAAQAAGGSLPWDRSSTAGSRGARSPSPRVPC
ncbi:MAG TPA: hypothetical protein VGL03_08195 [Thermoanaerobaculia bacterium]|jgi:hypothetical protein